MKFDRDVAADLRMRREAVRFDLNRKVDRDGDRISGAWASSNPSQSISESAVFGSKG